MARLTQRGQVESGGSEYEILNGNEQFWRDYSDFLESRGYRLRPRFRQGWVPSWHSTGQHPLDCEDARFHMTRAVMDATRLSDGQQVALKTVFRGSDEVKISLMLSSTDALKDPMNHSVPILEYFGVPDAPGPDFLVMPLLHAFDIPDFYRVSEVVEFVKQTLEGLLYMHRRGVAHRDLSGPNIMLDAPGLYPDGVHPDPFWDYLLPDRLDLAKPRKRSDLEKVTYYFVDFGISSYFDDPRQPRLVTGIDGIDDDVPERDLTRPYDPFPVDIFALGNTYKELFKKYRNLRFLLPLADRMTQLDPQRRPTADEALALYRELIDNISPASLTKRLRHVNESVAVHYVRELSSTARSLLASLRGLFTQQTAVFMTIIPIGISAFILCHGNHRIFNRIRSLLSAFGGIWK